MSAPREARVGAVVGDDDHRNRDEDDAERGVAEDESGHPAAQERVVEHEADARQQAAITFRLVLMRRPGHRHEQRHEREGDEVRRSIDDEYDGGSDECDEDSAERRPAEHREPSRALEQGVPPFYCSLVLVEDVRDDDVLSCGVGGSCGTEREGEPHEGRQREVPGPVENGTSSISGARTASQSRIVRCEPRRSSNEPLGIPNNAKPEASAATTKAMCSGPAVVRTNHGSAIHVICAPVVEDLRGEERR